MQTAVVDVVTKLQSENIRLILSSRCFQLPPANEKPIRPRIGRSADSAGVFALSPRLWSGVAGWQEQQRTMMQSFTQLKNKMPQV